MTDGPYLDGPQGRVYRFHAEPSYQHPEHEQSSTLYRCPEYEELARVQPKKGPQY